MSVLPPDDPFAPLPSSDAVPAPAKPVPELISPVPPDAPPPTSFRRPGQQRPADACHEYRDAEGRLVGAALRWDATADAPKDFAQVTYRAAPSGPRWLGRGMPPPRPLYNLPELAEQPDAPVLVVEGEKTADAARQYLPAGALVTTSNSGSNAAGKSDWTPLRARRVAIWRDNDEPGVKYAKAVAAILQGPTHGVGAAHVSIIQLPPGLAPGWDLADPLPPTMTTAAVTAMIEAALAPPKPRTSSMNGNAEWPETEHDHKVARELNAKFRFLGYRNSDSRAFFQVRSSGNFLHVTSAECSKVDQLRKLHPGTAPGEWWSGLANRTNARPDWHYLADVLWRLSEASDHFNPSNVRGVGASWDSGRTVIHLGDRLVVDGQEMPLASIDSKYIYRRQETRLPFNRNPLSSLEAGQLVQLSRKLRWTNPAYAELFAGWLVVALVCGALHWRPHIWITGAAGSGKTFINDHVIGPILGKFALYPASNSTEPGIRRALDSDARPVVFDEAEAGTRYEDARKPILGLMRVSSAGDNRRILMSSQTGEVVTFDIRSCFCLASIGLAKRSEADDSRVTILELERPVLATAEQIEAAEAQFTKIKQAIGQFGPDYGERLFARVALHLGALMQSIEVFKSAIASTMAGRRVADQYGTLLAGRWLLASTEPPTIDQALAMIEAQRIGALVDGRDTRPEELVLIDLLMSLHMRPTVPSTGTQRDITVGQACAVTAGLAEMHGIDKRDAYLIALAIGLKFRPAGADGFDAMPLTNPRAEQAADEPRYDPRKADGFWIHTTHDRLTSMLRKSEYGGDYGKVLKRHFSARGGDKTVSFTSGVKSRAIWLPLCVLLGEERPGDDDGPADPV